MEHFDFEWNSEKAASNKVKHGVTFEEAKTVFADSLSLTISDEEHSTIDEERFVIVGQSNRKRLLVVAFCERGDRIRIISARKATRREQLSYEEGE